MVNFVEVRPEDVDVSRLGRRGRVSYPLLKSFLESGMYCAEMKPDGLEKQPTYLRAVLTSYIKNHGLPIKIFSAGGKTMLLRLDMDPKTKEINPDWSATMRTTEGAAGHLADLPPQPISAAEVEQRFGQEKGQTTK